MTKKHKQQVTITRNLRKHNLSYGSCAADTNNTCTITILGYNTFYTLLFGPLCLAFIY